MKKSTKFVVIPLALIAIVIISVIFIPRFSKEKAGENPGSRQQGPLIAEGFVILKTDLDNEIRTVGNLIPNEEVDVRSETSKRLVGIHFAEGTFVPRGKILFTLDNSDIAAQLRKLEIQESLIIKKLERSTTLKEKGLLPEEDYDILQTELETVRAEMDVLGIQLSRTRIKAPFSGIVGLRNVSRGSYVTPGEILTTLQDVSRIKVDFSIPERYSSSFTRGQKVIFTVDGIDEEFTAEVYASEPSLNENTRSVLIRAVTSNPRNLLKPGTFAKVTLKLSDIKDAILIPSQALIPKLEGHEVYIVRNGKAVPTNVDIGMRTESQVQIFSPEVLPGDTIVMTNILRLKPNADVKIIKVN